MCIRDSYNTIPLNAEGADLTAYPTVYLNSTYNDGTVGSNNNEADTDYVQTIDRRGLGFDKDYGIKTVYLTSSISGAVTSDSIVNPTGATAHDLRNIWFVTSRTASNGVADTGSVQTIGLSTVVRPELGTTACLQLVLYGRKDYLDNIFVEYDDNVTTKRRLLYKTENDANGEVNEIGWVSDYNETILPLVGVAKPKDFSLVKRPEGFNGDTDIVVSKGRTAGGQTPYSLSLIHISEPTRPY